MDDLTWLRMAALAAEKAQPEKTFENPRVGAVIVKNGQAIAIGWHEYFGGHMQKLMPFGNSSVPKMLWARRFT